MKKQVNKDHYDFKRYVNLHRWSSYYYQLYYALDEDIKDILLFGVGDNIIPNILKQMNKNVTTFDLDEDLNPDIAGDITKMNKYLKKKYDCVMCCQILEHIPFENFEKIVKDILSFTKKKVILSLPYNSECFKIKFGFKGKEKNFKLLIKRFWKPYNYKRKFDIKIDGFNEHYWEVNVKGYSKKMIIDILKKYFIIEKEFIPFENAYHLFFILKPKK